MEIKEKLLKDSFERSAPMSMDVTRVVVDTRAATHDILGVYVRLISVGRLVTDKSDSITLARRLIPESLRYDKEPSTLTSDATKLADAYFLLMVEARAAVSTRDVTSLAAFLRKVNDSHGNSPVPPDCRGLVSDGLLRSEDAGAEQAQPRPS